MVYIRMENYNHLCCAFILAIKSKKKERKVLSFKCVKRLGFYLGFCVVYIFLTVCFSVVIFNVPLLHKKKKIHFHRMDRWKNPHFLIRRCLFIFFILLFFTSIGKHTVYLFFILKLFLLGAFYFCFCYFDENCDEGGCYCFLLFFYLWFVFCK